MTVVMHRILVVSESRITRRVVEMTFADQPVELVTALTGPAGLEAWDARGAAVVLADVSMDGLDGLALARHVQATAGTRPAAVLLMAGQHDLPDAAAVAAADVRAVIRKPLDSLQLIDAVREVLRTARPPKPAPAASLVGQAEPRPEAPAAVAADSLSPDGVVAAWTSPEPDQSAVMVVDDAVPALGADDLERVAARVAALWSGDARHEARVQELVAARAEGLTAASATAAVARLAPAAASAAAERLVREMAPALVEQVARLVVADFAERLVREEIARMRSAHAR
ncbi:MAG: response regulator [Acidobacteriota bacterium]